MTPASPPGPEICAEGACLVIARAPHAVAITAHRDFFNPLAAAAIAGHHFFDAALLAIARLAIARAAIEAAVVAVISVVITAVRPALGCSVMGVITAAHAGVALGRRPTNAGARRCAYDGAERRPFAADAPIGHFPAQEGPGDAADDGAADLTALLRLLALLVPRQPAERPTWSP
jgi:hypothetical protein